MLKKTERISVFKGSSIPLQEVRASKNISGIAKHSRPYTKPETMNPRGITPYKEEKSYHYLPCRRAATRSQRQRSKYCQRFIITCLKQYEEKLLPVYMYIGIAHEACRGLLPLPANDHVVQYSLTYREITMSVDLKRKKITEETLITPPEYPKRRFYRAD